VPLGAASNPTPSDLNQIGCTYFLTGAKTNLASSTAPINLTNTGTLPIGTYILVGGCTYGPVSTITMTLVKTGLFFDTSSGIVDSTTNGTPYFASASFITGNSIVITGAVGNGIRMSTTMLINLTSPTIIYFNYYAQYTGVGYTVQHLNCKLLESDKILFYYNGLKFKQHHQYLKYHKQCFQ